jgi:hypothetical protein
MLVALSAPATADYSIRAVGPFVSIDETVIDAAAPDWLLVRDNSTDSSCIRRVNLSSGVTINLCDKGLHNAIRVNSSGVVLGTTPGSTDLAVWGDRSGLKILQRPNDEFTSIEPSDLADNGMVIGTTTLVTERQEDGYIDNIYTRQAYVWNSRGIPSPRSAGKGWNTQGLAINARGESVVYADRADSGGSRLLTGKRQLRRIDRRGARISPSPYYSHRINNRGQILLGSGYLYSPKTGWRELAGGGCDRCDLSTTGSLSQGGKAIYNRGWGYTISDYPNPVIRILCLTPQNQQIEGTNRRISDFEEGYISGMRFLGEDRVVMSADVKGDDRAQRIFIMTGVHGNSQDFCPTLSLSYEGIPSTNNCENSTSSKVMTCRGRVRVESVRGPLDGIPLEVFASQSIGYGDDFTCAPNRLDQLVSHRSGTAFEVTTDPGFAYHIRITDPRYRSNWYTYVTLRMGKPIATAINSCRKPFEALPAENQ